MGKTRKNVHSDFKDKIFGKHGKMLKWYVSTVLFLVFEEVANFFSFSKVDSFVVLEKFDRIDKARKNVHFNFQEFFFEKMTKNQETMFLG